MERLGLDGDGDAGTPDLLIMLPIPDGPCPGGPGCLGDIDGDGEISVVDLLILLAAWGPCP